MDAKSISRKAVPALAIAMALLAASLAWCVPKAYAGDAPATQYVDRHWENGQVVSEAKTQGDVAWMTDGHLEWHDGWWYTRDLDELVISDRVSVDDGATANLILMDGKTIKFENGIHVGKGSTLNIYGQAQGTGRLVVGRSEADTAAIGGNAGESCGAINVYGGTIEVTGGSHSSNGGAGIGAGGSASNEGAISVYGGTVASTGGANAAGIGGGANGGHGGAIAIYGGNVTANGDSGAAGIGGGEGGSGTGTFIHGGEVHAKGGSSSADGGAGIGSGGKAGREGVVGGNVYVFGGSVYATGGADAAGIGGGNEVSGGYVEINGVNGGAYVEASGGTLGAGIGGGQNGDGGTVEIRKGEVKATGGGDAAGIGGGDSGGGVDFTIYAGKVEATGGSYAAGIGTGDADNGGKDGGTIRIYGGDVTATGGCDGAGIGGGEGGSGANVEICGGTVNASGGSTENDGGAGIGSGDKDGKDVNAGTIKIYDGNVTATGGADGAGLGGGDEVDGGTIEIHGGTVNASTLEGVVDASWAAGIGGGDGGNGGTIRIYGGTVGASGGDGGAGIGGGNDGNGGDIEISGGTVTATSQGVNRGGAGIGGGDDGNGGIVKIKGGNVMATGGYYAAGIGGGGSGDCGTVEISGGTINATGGEYLADKDKGEKEGGPGIGNGGHNSGGSDATQKITIDGGSITATGKFGAAGIGTGFKGNNDNISITINDCEKLTAWGGTRAAGIGGCSTNSDGNSGGNITITGGNNITANGGGGAAGIGGARNSNGTGGKIRISGGNIKASGGTDSTTGYAGAGIGGGCFAPSGDITIDGGTIEANGANNGGAGIGSGAMCAVKENAVNVKINGGTVVAKGGDGLVSEESGGHGSYYPGAAIGAGGYYYQNMQSDDKSYFAGNIYLNGGNITVNPCSVSRRKTNDGWFEFDESHSNYFNLIGTTNDKGLEGVVGNVFFNGATVTMNNGKGRDGSYAQPVRATNVYISDEHVGQRVSYKVNETDELAVVKKDDRNSTLNKTGNNQVVVKPCQHENSTYVDNGNDHSLTCDSCGTSGTEAHDYGDPAWTWGENHASAIAKFKCSACQHVETLNADVSADEIGPIGDDPAKTVYTATVTFGGKEYTTTYEEGLASFTYSLTLQDSIDVNFYVKDLAGDPLKYQVAYGPGDEQTDAWKTATPASADSNHYVIASRAAKEMGDEVHVVVKYDGQVIKDGRYSVKGYCDAVIAGEYPDKLKDLCRATLDYGSYAQEAFGYNADKPANGGADNFTNADISVPTYGATKDGKSESITGVTLSLVTTSKTQLVVRFKCGADSAEGFSATVRDAGSGEPQPAGVSYENGKLKVVVEHIAAKDLDVKKEIALTCPDGTYTFTVSPVDYMGLAVSKESQVELNRAFYNYHLKAKAFADGSGQPAVLNRAPSASGLTAVTGL